MDNLYNYIMGIGKLQLFGILRVQIEKKGRFRYKSDAKCGILRSVKRNVIPSAGFF